MQLNIKKQNKKTKTQNNPIKKEMGRRSKQLCTSEFNNLEETKKLLETYSLPKLNGREIENLNKPIMSKKTESVSKNSHQTKART